MTDPRLDHLYLKELSAALGRDSARVAPHLHALRLSAEDCAAAAVTIRFATPFDAGALAQLAELDSQPVPPGSVLLAEVFQQPVAAISLFDRAVVADPFLPTTQIVELLRLRARQLRPPRRFARLFGAWRARAALSQI